MGVSPHFLSRSVNDLVNEMIHMLMAVTMNMGEIMDMTITVDDMGISL